MLRTQHITAPLVLLAFCLAWLASLLALSFRPHLLPVSQNRAGLLLHFSKIHLDTIGQTSGKPLWQPLCRGLCDLVVI
jgi:hypothetical protein